jgi:hypothetical protein
VGGLAAGASAIYLLRKTGVLGLGQTSDLPDSQQALGVMVRQIRRYAFASSQDLSPIVGLTHASYALVLLDTLEEVAGRDAVTRSGVDAKKLRTFITKLQDRHAESMEKCDSHLQRVLAIERGEGNQPPGFVVAGAWAAPRGA